MQEKFSQTSVASTVTISLLLKRYIVEDKIRAHIISYPTRHSHYSRKDNSHRVYLFPELSVAWLRQAFWKSMILSICNSKRRTESSIFISNKPTKKKSWENLVTEHLYHDMFAMEFNTYFGYPRTDTCDRLSIEIDVTPLGKERTVFVELYLFNTTPAAITRWIQFFMIWWAVEQEFPGEKSSLKLIKITSWLLHNFVCYLFLCECVPPCSSFTFCEDLIVLLQMSMQMFIMYVARFIV